MAQDYFLKIDGLPGESTDVKHKGELDIESFSWGETNSGSAGQGAGASTGKVQPQDFVLTKRLDKSSPILFIACATGQHFKDALLTVRKAGAGQHEYVTLKMSDVLVSGYHTAGSEGGGGVVNESVSLKFATLEMVYKEQKPDGSLGGEIKQGYDFKANKKL